MAIRIYADHNATSPLLRALLKPAQDLLVQPFANASSLHAAGQRSRQDLEAARASIATLLDCQASAIAFTSTATEANNLALRGHLKALGKPRATIVTSAIEHPSVLEPLKHLRDLGADLRVVAAERSGAVSIEAMTTAMEGADLVALMWANNETGVVQPVAEISAVCRARGIRLHIDAVQACGKLAIRLSDVAADTFSISAHKLGGLAGAAALVVLGSPPAPLWLGGGHEHGLRGGTEPLHAISIFGATAEQWVKHGDAFRSRMLAARDAFERQLSESSFDHTVLGAAAARLPNTSNVLVAGLRGEALLSALDLAGVAVSHGSACATGSLEPSSALLGAGLTEAEARTALRVSFGPESSEDDGSEAARRLIACANRLRSIAR